MEKASLLVTLLDRVLLEKIEELAQYIIQKQREN
jgi:hypothetical protein